MKLIETHNKVNQEMHLKDFPSFSRFFYVHRLNLTG